MTTGAEGAPGVPLSWRSLTRIRHSLATASTRSSEWSSFRRSSVLFICLSFAAVLPAIQWAGGSDVLAAASQPTQTDSVHAEEEHDTPLLETIARLTNFAVLVGILFVLLRRPLSIYLSDRSDQVRAGLAQARATSAEAAQQLEAIKERLLTLPNELETLRVRGQEEVAAEEKRLRESTEAARQRLIEESRRELALQLRVAKQQLTQHAAALATRVAAQRIQDNLSAADQLRLVDRYVDQVRPG